MLSVSNLSVEFGSRRIFEELSFVVEPYEAMVIAGGNGTGKSTLFRTIAGLVRPTAGSISCFGCSTICQEPHMLRRAGMAYLPQGGCVFSDLTVQENLRLSCAWSSAQGTNTAPYDLLRRGYSGSIHQRVGLLSRGQQQLLSIEMTLANEPKVLLLDEPFAPLSPRLRQLVAEVIVHFTMSRGCVTLLAEHDLETLAAIPTRHIELGPPPTQELEAHKEGS